MKEFTVIIAGLTLFFSILTKIWGFPAQAKLLYKTKNVSNISLSFYVLLFISYLLWTIHGALANDKAVMYGQGLGVITTGVIIFQIIYYGRKKKD